MRIAAALALLALAACQKSNLLTSASPAASVAPATAAAPSATPAALATAPVQVLGWTTDGGDFLLLSRQAPAFTASLIAGGEVSLEKLRGRWTIVGFRSDFNSSAQEDTFFQALRSAADQDPDLDALAILVPAEASTPMPAARTFIEGPAVFDADRKIAAAFGVTDLPVYLLIGPDLTIEGVRGPLSASPDNGIKDVVRGVAEIRKQIAAPG